MTQIVHIPKIIIGVSRSLKHIHENFSCNFFSLGKMVSGFLVAAYYDLSFFHCSHSVTFIHVKRTALCSLEKIIGQSYSMYSFLLVMAIWAVFV